MPIDPSASRYDRQLKLPGFGAEAQEKLGRARVLVVGAGGLGVPALQYLCAMGVGAVGIVDDDLVSLSNLHRQVIYATADIGRPKAGIAAQRLSAMNPELRIDAYQQRLAPANALELIGAYDYVLDATDNIATRYLINDACVILDKPFVYGAVHRFEGHVSVFNFDGGPTYRCLYPDARGGTEVPDCNTSGVLGVVPALIGCRQALELVKIIAGIGKSLSGFLLVIDFLNDTHRRIRLKASPDGRMVRALQESYGRSCASDAPMPELPPAELAAWYRDGHPFTLLDVREPYEYAQGHLPQAGNLPLSDLSTHEPMIPSAGPVVLYCQKGSRSIEAAALLRRLLPGLELYSLSGGIEGWQKAGAL